MTAQQILVALDGSEKDERAIAAALAARELANAGIHLVRVVVDPLTGVTRDAQRSTVGLRSAPAIAASVATDQTEAENAVASVVANLPAPVKTVATWEVLRSPDVAGELIQEIAARQPLLTVLATRAPGARSRAIAGSVADRVMRESVRPVILVPPGAAFLAGKQPTISRVLVPLDDSSLSFRSLEFLIEMPCAADIEYALVAVVENERERVTAEERLATTTAWLRSRGASKITSSVPVSTDVAAAIVDATRQALAEAIVMSTRGASGIGRLLLGSVAEQVVRQSELPVMLLTPRMLGAR